MHEDVQTDSYLNNVTVSQVDLFIQNTFCIKYFSHMKYNF